MRYFTLLAVFFLAASVGAAEVELNRAGGGSGGGVTVGGSIAGSPAASCILHEDSAASDQLACDANGTLTNAGLATFLGVTFGADPADAGEIRLPNAGCIESEASPAGTDMSICSDTGEYWTIVTGSTGMIFPDGAAATPSIRFNGATNTGIIRNGSVGGMDMVFSGISRWNFAVDLLAASASALGWSGSDVTQPMDTRITRDGAAASIAFANAASATPTAYTLRIGSSSRGGTDSNVAGANGTIKSGDGTGTGAVSNLTFQTPNLGSSGSTAQTYGTRLILNQPCTDSAGDAACGAATSGNFVIDAADTNTVVSTTNVTAGSQIFIMEDSSLGTLLGVTCNTTIARTYAVTARTAATSFTVTASAAPTTNPACLSYFIVN